MVSVLSDPSLYEFTGGRPPTLDELARQYAFQSRGGPADNSEVWLNLLIVLKDTDEAIGYVQATIPTQEHSAEIAWVVGAPWQGVGHAKEAAALLVAELSQRGVKQIMANIRPRHEASAAAARSLGMHPTAEIIDGEIRWETKPGKPSLSHEIPH